MEEGLSSPESRTRAMRQKLQSVRFWFIKNKKSCPASGLKVGVQRTELPSTEVDKHKSDGTHSEDNKGSTPRF